MSWVQPGKKIYLIREKDAEKAKSNKKLLPFDEFLDANIQEYIKENAVSFHNNAPTQLGTMNVSRFKSIDASKLKNEVTRQRVADIMSYSDKLSAINVSHARKIKHFCVVSKRITENDFDAMLNNIRDSADKIRETSAYFSRYRMLSYLAYSVPEDVVCEYINMVDRDITKFGF
jgi:hypothetical protein